MVSRTASAIRTFWCIFNLARISPPWISFPLRTNSTFQIRRVLVRARFATLVAGTDRALRRQGRAVALPLGSAPPCHRPRRPPDADQGPGSPGRVEGDGPRGCLPLSRRGGPDSELRRREARGGKAGRAPALEASPGDQGQPRLPPDARSAGRARGREDADHGRPAA